MAKPTEMEYAKAGILAEVWSTTHLFKVTEALPIDRFKFIMVPKGQKGQNELSFYLPAKKMRALCMEIHNKIAHKKIAADQGADPAAYKYVTGEKGSRTLLIGGGKYGCRVRIINSGKAYTVAMSMDELEDMAERFLMWTGLIPTTPGSHYHDQMMTFNEGRKDRINAFKKVSADELDDAPADVADEAPVEEARPSSVDMKAPKKKGDVQEYNLTVTGTKKAQKNYWRFDAKLGDEAVVLLFNQTDVPNIEGFDALEEAAKQPNGVNVNLYAERRDNFLLYQA